MLPRVVLFVMAAGAFAAPVDYSDPKAWLCRPGQHDACDTDLTTTVISTDGKMSRETWKNDAGAPVDCFYVYPTVSTDPTPYSDMTPDPAELNVIRQQFARFGSKCRRFAPMYRQITLAGLRQLLAGAAGFSLDHGTQYDDVLAAWNYYLEHDNHGRRFVLIGHSQGSFILTRLVKEEIDGKPIQSKMLSAILPGATIPVPRGKDVGGAFQHVPLCQSATQKGCLIAYSSFRVTSPPPANTRFGKVADPNMAAACVNPAALSGTSGELHAYFATEGSTIAGAPQPSPWGTGKIATPWVSVPGTITGRCTSNENGTFLEVTTRGDIPGDLFNNGQVMKDWGLHLIDMNLAIGNLIDIVGQETKARK